ncbi:MAG: hypothetical protein ACLP8S_16280 [Solirubrobacteraceae bacterium]
MGFRTIYLTRGPRASGHDHFAGRLIYEELRRASDEALLAWVVLDAADDNDPIHPNARDDFINHETFAEFRPDVVYVEGGLLADPEHWRIPRKLALATVRSGGVLFIADVDYNKLTHHKAEYRSAVDLLGACADYGRDDASSPIYGITRGSLEPEVDCPVDSMLISDWLRPVYDGIDRLLVWRPILLHPVQNDLLATCPASSTDLHHRDMLYDEKHLCPFATVHSVGDGYVVLIAAGFSHDLFTRNCPDNARWVVNVAKHLSRDAADETSRREPLRRLQHDVARARELAAELEGDDAGDVYAQVLDAALESTTPATLRSQRAANARERLRAHFGMAWERLGQDCRDNLVVGDVLRTDLEEYSSIDPSFDFAAAVHVYSRALESEVLDKLFEPLRGARDVALPHGGEKRARALSVEALRRLRDEGVTPTLGAMGHCLLNVGCAMADREGNGFAQWLDALLIDRAAFCSSFPKQLINYTDRFRNAAAHVGRLSLDECVEARSVLLEEPTRLLLQLASALQTESE